MFYFPYEKVRSVQAEFMDEIAEAIKKKYHIVVHAPTGIGKTAAVLAPTIKLAKENNLTVIFLTSRHTQHKIVIETLQLIKEKFNVEITVADIIGKKWMCSQEVAKKMYSSDFFDYCKKLKEDSGCKFFNNFKGQGKISTEAENLVIEFKKEGAAHCEELVTKCTNRGMCAYEISMVLAKLADVIVADYNFVFDPLVKKVFFTKLGKQLEKCIVIVDEGHNLPNRLRENMSDQLTQVTLDAAIKELKDKPELQTKVQLIKEGFDSLGFGLQSEKEVKKEAFSKIVEYAGPISMIHDELELFADQVREKKERSWCGGLARFLNSWVGQDPGFVRFMRKTDRGLVLFYKALDPALLSREIIESTHTTIMMSGTLTPTQMFCDLLGFPKSTKLLEYESPFPEENRLALIVPLTTTKYAMRTPEEYKRIATILGAVADEVPGNVAFFFPSYKLRDDIAKLLSEFTNKEMLFEERGMSKEAKTGLLNKFVSLRLKGAILMGIVRGSFGEGIDFPGDWLHGVVVVGLPLAKPNIETQAIIDYFNNLNNRGLEYGYIFPAINLAIQSAGRCIRSEKDTGVVILLDERYAYPRYMACLPKEWNFGVTRNFPALIEEFFS